MLIAFEGVNGQTMALDAFEIVAILPASAKDNSGVPMLGMSSVMLRGAGGGLGVKGGPGEHLERVNEVRRQVLTAKLESAQAERRLL